MTAKKMDLIYSVLLKYNGSHEVLVKLTDLGFNMKDAITIYNEYKENTLDMLQHNIYSFTSIPEISFPKLDLIDQKMDYESNCTDFIYRDVPANDLYKRIRRIYCRNDRTVHK